MDVNFLNASFQEVFLLDSFDSLLWVDRYWAAGEIKLVCDPSERVLTALSGSKYFRIKESPHRMVFESFRIKTNPDKGDQMIIEGRSLESILDRRIVWDQTNMTGNLQTAVLDLLDDNVINPTDTDRDMPFSTITSTDPAITGLSIDTQFVGEYIYDIVSAIGEAYGIGFRVFYSTVTSLFTFELYSGVDRSYDQSTNPTVAFTTELNNLINSDYVEDASNLKTVCLVAGEEGVGNVRTTVEVDLNPPGGGYTGLNRRETYLEASINRRTPEGELTDAQYILALEGKGIEALSKKRYIQAFDGEVDTRMYNYGDDFAMGDILQIADNYGHSAKSRVIEMVYSQDKSGIKKYPIFEPV